MRAKSALVTGAGQKLGAELARALGRKRFVVFVHVHNSVRSGQRVVEDIKQAGGDAYLIAADLTNQGSLRAALTDIFKIKQHVDIVINNASIFDYDSPGQGDSTMLLQSLKIHAQAPFEIAEFLHKSNQAERKTDIFNILDQKLFNMNPDYYSYTVGKAALKAITTCWQKKNLRNIRVFGILPGNMYPSGPQTQSSFARAISANPLRRAVQPSEICDAILFFHARQSLLGQDLIVDAGEHLMTRSRDPAFDETLLDDAC